MNKLRTILTWGLLLAATHVMGYTITVSPTQIETGQSTNLIINLNNTETNLTAYQMKLFLPTGVTVQKKANGKYDYTANADRHDGAFTFTVKDAADGSVLIAVFSPDKDVITGTSGELIRLPIDVASSVTSSLQGSLKEIEFTDVNTQAYNISDVNFTLTIGGTDKEQQTLSLASLPEMTEGDAAHSLPQQTNQGLTLTWTVTDATIASINGYQLTPLKAGTTTVTATQAGNSNYLPFTKTFTLTVNERQTQPEIEVTDISQLENAIYIDRVEARAGATATLSVKMKNSFIAEGFGFDLVLPEGITVSLDEYGFPMAELSTERTNSRITNHFDVDFKLDGSLNVQAYSTRGLPIEGHDGEVALITIKVSEDLAAGEYPIILKNIAITDENSSTFTIEQVTSVLEVPAYKIGDANNDGNVNVGDLTAISHYILERPDASFLFPAADANQDGNVNVGDLTAVSHIILWGSIVRPQQGAPVKAVLPKSSQSLDPQ